MNHHMKFISWKRDMSLTVCKTWYLYQEHMRGEGGGRAYNSMYGSRPHVPKIWLFLEHPAFEFSRLTSLLDSNAHAQALGPHRVLRLRRSKARHVALQSSQNHGGP